MSLHRNDRLFIILFGAVFIGLGLAIFYARDADARSVYPPNIPLCTTADHQTSSCQGVQQKLGETIIITDPSFNGSDPCSLNVDQAPGGNNVAFVDVWCEKGEEDWFQTRTSVHGGSVDPISNLDGSNAAGTVELTYLRATGVTDAGGVRYIDFFNTLANPTSVTPFQFIMLQGIAAKRTAPAAGSPVSISVAPNMTFNRDGGVKKICATVTNAVVDPDQWLFEASSALDSFVFASCTISGSGTLAREARECCMRNNFMDTPFFIPFASDFDIRVTPVTTPDSDNVLNVSATWVGLDRIVIIGASSAAGTVAHEPGVPTNLDQQDSWAFELQRTHMNKFVLFNDAFPGSNSQDWDRNDASENCRYTDAIAESIQGRRGPAGPLIDFSEPAAFVIINLLINDATTFRTCSGGAPTTPGFTGTQLTDVQFKTVTESVIARVRFDAPFARIILLTDYSAPETCPDKDDVERCQYVKTASAALLGYNAVYHDIADCPLDCRTDTCGGPLDPASDPKCRDGVTATDDPATIMQIPSIYFPNYSEITDPGVSAADRIHVGELGHEVLHGIVSRALELALFEEPLFVDH